MSEHGLHVEISELKVLKRYHIQVVLDLKKENKDLRESLEETTDLVVDYQNRIEKLKQSRDELLVKSRNRVLL